MKAQGTTSVEKLLSISSDPLGPRPNSPPTWFESYTLGPELFRMLEKRNGFYAFESALHVFPIGSPNCMSLEEWNAPSLWRHGYQNLASGLLFFAEDVFQDQFCLSGAGVGRFESETGQTVFLADSVEKWAAALLKDYGRETGWALASKWQVAHGPLPVGQRLMPKTPFLLGGEYSIENLWVGILQKACV